MITRVRIDAEASTTQACEDLLCLAHEALEQKYREGERQYEVLWGHSGRALADARAGEAVYERCTRQDGAIFYRGRMTSHYAPSGGDKLT